jgi:transposase
VNKGCAPDDETDAFFLAEMSRLGILPEGYIYPKEERPVRDLLRRRLLLVHQKTAHTLSFQNLVARERGEKISGNRIYQLSPEDVKQFFKDERLVLMGQTNIEAIHFLDGQIKRIEKAVFGEVKLRPEYEKLLTVPGIGKILAFTIMLETGDISRYAKVGNYTSYCRCVKSGRLSNNKKKGENNRKNGNKYLSWAYVEAANFIRRYCPEAKSWYQRKLSRSKQVVATKALASKLSKACYFIIKDQVDFDVKKIFG